MKAIGLHRRTVGDVIFDIVIAIFLIIFMVVLLYPLINTVAISFNDGTDALRGGIYLWPRMFTTKNYETVLQKSTMATAAFVTVMRTVIGTLSSTLVTSLLAYILSRPDYVFKKQLSVLYVVTMYVSGGLIPIFIVYKNLGLTNNFWVYILPGMVSAWNMLVMRTYINGLPASICESAEIDGAGHMTIFFRIVMPLCMPVIATIALFTAVGQWNSWFDAMLYNRMSDNLTTLQYELMKLLNSVTNNSGSVNNALTSVTEGGGGAGRVTPTSVRAAATVVTSLPILCLYPFLQKYFVSGLTIGGVKE